jgi:beta-N-acetylhexosaminidase
MDAPLLVDLQGAALTPDDRDLLARDGVAGVCLFARNLTGIEQGRELVAAILEAAGRPLLIAIDQEGGGVVRLPQAAVPPGVMALGAADDPALTEALGAATGRGLRRIGVNVDFAPVADVQSNPANPVIGDRSFGADPALVSRHVAAFVVGLQGSGVAATLKHFPGHGDVAVDSHLGLPRLEADRERLDTLEWPPFVAGIEAGAEAVMSAHVVASAVDRERPATLSRALLEGVLRDRLGFGGVVFSDALEMRAISQRWGVPEAAVLASAAGVDVPVVCNAAPAQHHAVLDALARARAEGRLDPAALSASSDRVARLLAAYPSAGLEPAPERLAADAELEAEAARRAITAVGSPPRLAPRGPPVVLLGRALEAAGAASDPARPVAALKEALEAAGVSVRWVHEADALAGALSGAQALVVATAERAPLAPEAVQAYREAFVRAHAAHLPAVHAALANPDHARALPGPALLSFGVRPSAAAALARALLSGEAPGRAPVPLAGRSEP